VSSIQFAVHFSLCIARRIELRGELMQSIQDCFLTTVHCF